MRVLIVGGTGFLGYHATLEFLRRGHTVTGVALPPLPTEDLLPPEVTLHFVDVNKCPDEEVRELLIGHDAVVYAAGVDDRVTPEAPAYPVFYEGNVTSASRLIRLAKEAGVRRGVVLGSYFAYFNREWPQLEMARHHPYIRSRVEQATACIEAGGDRLDVMILELGYIFGSMPGRTPLWKPLIDYLRSPFPVFYSAGGTNAIAVAHVAEAIVGAVEQGEGGQRYTIGDENLTWREMLTRLARADGREKRIITLPKFVVRAGAQFLKLSHRLQGREAGLDPVRFVEVQTRKTYLDPTPSQEALGYKRGGLDEAFADTVAAC